MSSLNNQPKGAKESLLEDFYSIPGINDPAPEILFRPSLWQEKCQREDSLPLLDFCIARLAKWRLLRLGPRNLLGSFLRSACSLLGAGFQYLEEISLDQKNQSHFIAGSKLFLEFVVEISSNNVLRAGIEFQETCGGRLMPSFKSRIENCIATLASINEDGCNLADAIFELGYLDSIGVIPECNNAALFWNLCILGNDFLQFSLSTMEGIGKPIVFDKFFGISIMYFCDEVQEFTYKLTIEYCQSNICYVFTANCPVQTYFRVFGDQIQYTNVQGVSGSHPAPIAFRCMLEPSILVDKDIVDLLESNDIRCEIGLADDPAVLKSYQGHAFGLMQSVLIASVEKVETVSKYLRQQAMRLSTEKIKNAK